MDIRTAFLNAPMDWLMEETSGGKLKKRSLMKPPPLLIALGFVKPGVWWEAIKAVYGYRQSPKLWSDFRDHTLHRKKAELDGVTLVLKQMISEPSMWLIVEESELQEDGKIRGIMLVYVDDLLICGDQEAITAMTESIRSTWEVSEPERINDEKGVRFLGMELWRMKDGSWKATQVGYTTDLLKRNLGEDVTQWPTRRVPVSKDVEEVAEDEKTPEDVRTAQRVVGELVWLSTRVRPDLMYVVAKLSSGITKFPKGVKLLASQVWAYLAGTLHQGLEFRNDLDENSLNVFADASFGDQCQGCTLIQWGSSPILWKSSRQALMSSSTAEAELIELLESVNAGEAVRVVIEEITNRECFAKAHTDSTSALATAVGESGSWKTRHLRRRAQALRWRVTKGDRVARHIPGAENPSDIGTKALGTEKLEKFKARIGMSGGRLQKKEEDGGVENGRQEDIPGFDDSHAVNFQGVEEDGIQRVLRAVILAAQFSIGRGQEDEEPQEFGRATLVDFFVFWVVIPGILCLVLILWMQRNSARKSLKVKVEEDEEKDREKALEEKIQKKVEEGVRRLRIEERESELLGTSSASGGEGLSRRLRRNQSDESHRSSISPIARVEDTRSEASNERNERREPASCPRMSFPQDAMLLYVSPGGSKYHYDSKCRGLRNATDVKAVPRCINCGPVQSKPKSVLFGSFEGEFHTIRGHAAIKGTYSQYEPCHICTRA